MAIAFIKHTPVSKALQAEPYTAAAHVRYITRQSATDYAYSERMPINYHAAQRFMVEREDSIRKNGRVCDKLIISLPREMTMEQATSAVRLFGFRLSMGRAPFYFTIQNFNEHNPHAHFIFVDADVETGKRVFRTSDRGSTERIKALWEEACNEKLLEYGLDASISFADARDKALERLAAEHGIPADENRPTAPLDPVDVSHEADRTFKIEPPEVEQVEAAMELVAPSGISYIRTALDGHKEHKRILAAFEARNRARDRAKAAKEAAERAADQAAIMEKKELLPLTLRHQQAEHRLGAYTTDRGLKGFEINIWGYSYKSPTRRQAEQAQHEFEAARFAREMKERDVKDAYHKAQTDVNAAKKAAEDYEIAQNRFLEIESVYGTEQEMAQAGDLFERQTFVNTREVTVQQIEEAYKEAAISGEEYRTLLTLKGEVGKVREWEEAQKDLGWQK